MTIRTGSIPFLNSRITSPFFAASIAAQTTIANRASSDGWKLQTGIRIHRRAPFFIGAIAWVPGTPDQQQHEGHQSSGQAHARQRR